MTFTVDDAQAYAEVRWQFAKTMRKWPHEYSVRQWRHDLEAEFLAFAALIRPAWMVKRCPQEASKLRYSHRYLEVDGWEYSPMGGTLSETTMINRARLAGSEHAGVDSVPNGRFREREWLWYSKT